MGRCSLRGSLLPAARRQKILAEVERQGSVSTVALARLLGVSEMTVHRDLAWLASRELVQKVFGGATALTPPVTHQAVCAVCGTAAGRSLDFTVQVRDGATQTACCPHCGLMLLKQLGLQAESAVTFDFITRRTVNVRSATYVVASAATPCCEPSVLAFGTPDDAARFRAGFGGQIADLEEAASWLMHAMGGGFVPLRALSASPERTAGS